MQKFLATEPDKSGNYKNGGRGQATYGIFNREGRDSLTPRGIQCQMTNEAHNPNDKENGSAV